MINMVEIRSNLLLKINIFIWLYQIPMLLNLLDKVINLNKIINVKRGMYGKINSRLKWRSINQNSIR